MLGLCGNFDGKVTNDLLTSSSSEVFSVLDFGNSWKTAAPPCSDVTHETFPCERHSYCAAWAQRRCMILRSDTFKDCHLKVPCSDFSQINNVIFDIWLLVVNLGSLTTNHCFYINQFRPLRSSSSNCFWVLVHNQTNNCCILRLLG